MSEQRVFGAVIIGDEILSGKRQDKHFERIAAMLGERRLRLSWVEYLGDERQRLANLPSADSCLRGRGLFLRRHRQYAGRPRARPRRQPRRRSGNPSRKGRRGQGSRFGDDAPAAPATRHLSGRGRIIPNPFNPYPGFWPGEHYFVPGFPQMAHP